MQNIIFIHGLESSGQGFKGQFFKRELPGCLTPNFEEYNTKLSIKQLLKNRMNDLYSLLKEKDNWIIIGSSFGGLMATLFTCQNPEKVSKLILLAPFLSISELTPRNCSPIDIPVVIFHGKNDKIVSLSQSQIYARKIFTNLLYNIVDDDHHLHKTVKSLDWKKLIIL
jgi:pimeloyl-ACP methyl ester carboxylesterase